MQKVKEIIACPICGAEVTLEDKFCPKCNVEFAPGVMNVPQWDERSAKKPGERRIYSSTFIQASIISIAYIVGYGTILAGSYVSSIGTADLNSMLFLAVSGGTTVAFAIFAAAYIGTRRGTEAMRVSVPMIVAFVMLLPMLMLMKW